MQVQICPDGGVCRSQPPQNPHKLTLGELSNYDVSHNSPEYCWRSSVGRAADL